MERQGRGRVAAPSKHLPGWGGKVLGAFQSARHSAPSLRGREIAPGSPRRTALAGARYFVALWLRLRGSGSGSARVRPADPRTWYTLEACLTIVKRNKGDAMKAAFGLALLLVLSASSATAQEQTDSFPYAGASAADQEEPSNSVDFALPEGRPCSFSEENTAMNHCESKHAPINMTCKFTSCLVRDGWIVYTWNGYW